MTQKSLPRIARLIVRVCSGVAKTVYQDVVRSGIATTAAFYIRAIYFCRIRGRLRTIESGDAFPVTINHNLLMLWNKLDRMTLLIRPLSVLEQIGKDSRILVIGPRNEWDLFLLHRSGFDFARCTGLDLISYSPKVVLGDMHSLPFNDAEFDVVLCGWTLSYSARPDLACKEMARVCKSRGAIGISVEYFLGNEDDERKATGGYTIQDSRLEKRVNSTTQVLDLFPSHGAVFFSHDAPLKRTVPRDPLPSNCAVIFENGPALLESGHS